MLIAKYERGARRDQDIEELNATFREVNDITADGTILI